MLPTLFLVLLALAGASAGVIQVRQNQASVASNIEVRATQTEPARGEGRRVLVWGRPDLALTVLGEPAAGIPVGVQVTLAPHAYSLSLDDANSRRQIFDVDLHDGDDDSNNGDDNDDDDDDDDNDDENDDRYDEPNQFDYDDDDDELRLRGTQLCVTMSSPGTLTLENCSDDRDDDNNWLQDWEFDDQDNQRWVRIEDDDDDNRCLTAAFDGWSGDSAQLTVEQCGNDNVSQRFYQVLPGEGAGAVPSGSGAPSSSASATSAPSSTGSRTQSAGSSTNSSPSATTGAAGASDSPNASRPRANMWGRSLFRLLADL